MSRRPRVEYQGAVYHVIQRGNNQEYIFDTPADKNYFVSILRDIVDIDGVELFAYVVMGNHYHLALRTHQHPLSKTMQRLNSKYGIYYNSFRERTGHVFQGRYNAFLIEDERYLQTVIKYIHHNPVRAEICSRVYEYKWSSDKYYRSLDNSFVTCNILLDLFADNLEFSLREYKKYMELEDDDGFSNYKAAAVDKSPAADKGIPDKPVQPVRSLEQILTATGAANNDIELIKSGSRQKHLVPLKAAYARTAVIEGYSIKKIGSYINVSDAAICKYLKKGSGTNL